MSRVSPRVDGGSISVLRFTLTDEQAAHIEAECGHSLDAAARAHLGFWLDWYLRLATQQTEAPKIRDAEEQFGQIHAAASNLLALVEPSGTAADWELRSLLRIMLDLEGDDDLSDCLHNLLAGVQRARAELDASRGDQNDAPGFIAHALATIWQERLAHERPTIWFRDGVASPFVLFARAATAALPSCWPWRPDGHRQEHSLEAFTQGLRRSM